MTSPTERTRLIQPPGAGYQQPVRSTIQVDPNVLARTMTILAAVQQRPQPLAQPISHPLVQQSLALAEGQYVGEVKDGVPHGMGTLTYRPGHERKLYEGTWQNGEFHGKGVLKFSNEDQFQGQWENGLQHGQGLQLFANGSKYEGSFIKGKKHGEGTLRYDNGDTYTGSWENEQKIGEGSYTWPNGDIYTGSWKNNQRTGQGTYKWPNGDEYVGGWLDSNKHGQGTKTDADGDYYSGEWQNGVWHGKGKRGWTDSDVYHTEGGIFRDGSLWEGTRDDQIIKNRDYVRTGVNKCWCVILSGTGAAGLGVIGLGVGLDPSNDDGFMTPLYVIGGVTTGLAVLAGVIFRNTLCNQPRVKDSCWG